MTDKVYPLKKAKEAFVYDIKSNKYYDFKNNTNILGHSYKKLTTIVKNHISSSWDIYNNSIYHRRFIKHLNNLFGDKYHITCCFSLIEFISRLINYSINQRFNIEIIGENFKIWFDKNFNYKNIINSSKNINIYDMAKIYLSFKGNKEKIENQIRLNKYRINILNYYWYPYLDISLNDADLIILPEIYSGNFKYIILLINKESLISDKKSYYSTSINEIPSLYIVSSLKLYHLIKQIETNNPINLGWDGFNQAGRIFIYKETSQYKKIIYDFLNKNIILNKEPPFYNYLPLLLEEYQVKFLQGLKK